MLYALCKMVLETHVPGIQWERGIQSLIVGVASSASE